MQELHLQSDTEGPIAWTAGLFREVRDDVIDSQVLAADPQTGLPRLDVHDISHGGEFLELGRQVICNILCDHRNGFFIIIVECTFFV